MSFGIAMVRRPSIVHQPFSKIFFSKTAGPIKAKFHLEPTSPDSSRGTGGHGFDPGPRPIKIVKNGTSCSSLGTQTYRVELGLVDPVSG